MRAILQHNYHRTMAAYLSRAQVPNHSSEWFGYLGLFLCPFLLYLDFEFKTFKTARVPTPVPGLVWVPGPFFLPFLLDLGFEFGVASRGFSIKVFGLLVD